MTFPPDKSLGRRASAVPTGGGSRVPSITTPMGLACWSTGSTTTPSGRWSTRRRACWRRSTSSWPLISQAGCRYVRVSSAECCSRPGTLGSGSAVPVARTDRETSAAATGLLVPRTATQTGGQRHEHSETRLELRGQMASRRPPAACPLVRSEGGRSSVRARAAPHGTAGRVRRDGAEQADAWYVARRVVEHAEPIQWAASTPRHRAQALRRWIRPYVGGVQLRDLGRHRVEEGAPNRPGGAKPRTANARWAALSAALTAAVEANRIPANPCYGVRPVPEGEPQRRALTPDRGRAGVCGDAAAARPVAVAVMAYAGLRPGEMLALRWDDVGASSLSSSTAAGRTTSSATRRRAGADGRARRAAARRLERYRPARAEPGALVVPSETGGYVDLHNWRRRVWTTACAGAGVKAGAVQTADTPTRACSSMRGGACRS